MPRKIYSEQFKKDAADAYESSEASVAQVASDLGVSRDSLQNWIHTFGTGKRARRNKEADTARYFAQEMSL